MCLECLPRSNASGAAIQSSVGLPGRTTPARRVLLHQLSTMGAGESEVACIRLPQDCAMLAQELATASIPKGPASWRVCLQCTHGVIPQLSCVGQHWMVFKVAIMIICSVTYRPRDTSRYLHCIISSRSRCRASASQLPEMHAFKLVLQKKELTCHPKQIILTTVYARCCNGL